jgi:hypothetical protein
MYLSLLETAICNTTKGQEMDVMMLWAFLGHLPIHAPRPFATPTPVYHALRRRTSFNRPSPHPPVVYLLPSPSPCLSS